MFKVSFKNPSGTVIGQGLGTIPATALVEALANLGTSNPMVSRAVLREWDMYLLDTAVSVGAKSLSDTLTEYPVELLDNGVSISIQAARKDPIQYKR